MKSGLRDRNNPAGRWKVGRVEVVSMKSGLRDRNNQASQQPPGPHPLNVSMKSGLRDRNNLNILCVLCAAVWESQ